MSNLAKYLSRLASREESERSNAAEDIGYADDPAGVYPLLDRLDVETSQAVREVIFQSLQRIRHDLVIDAAVKLLGSDDPYIRNQAVELLRKRGERAVPALRSALHSPSKDVRKLALDVLGMLGSNTGDLFRAALRDPDPNVVITAVEYLGYRRDPEFREVLERMFSEASEPMLICACLEALSRLGTPECLSVILRRYPGRENTPDIFLPGLLKVLAAYGSSADLEVLTRLVTHGGAPAREQAMNALVALHYRCRFPDLPAELKSALPAIAAGADPSGVRYQALTLAAQFPRSEEMIASAVRCLSEGDDLVRLGAVECLGRAESPAARAALQARYCLESQQEVRQAIAQALSAAGQ